MPEIIERQVAADKSKASKMSTQKRDLTWRFWGGIVVAVITVVGSIAVALINRPTQSALPPAVEKYPYTGIVRSHVDHKAVKDAQVFVSEDQNVPEQMRTDSDGIFHTKLASRTETIQLWVVQDGFETYKLQVKPNRIGMQEIELEPLKVLSALNHSKPRSVRPEAPTGLTGAAASSIPPVSADSLSIDTLRALASDIANKMWGGWLKEWEEDEHCINRRSMAPNSVEIQRIENECEERRKQFAKDSVGLVSDGNLLREAMIRRIGPVPEEWSKPFTAATTQNADVLRQMVKKLGP
jgi:hypothetical protein